METIRTSIGPAIKRRALLRGTPMAAAGAILLLFYGMRGVTPWGAAILLFALLLIASGLRPYRKLCRLETTPDELAIEKGHLHFIHRDKVQFAIPLSSIKGMSYEEVVVLHTEQGDVCLSHFSEKAYKLLQSRLNDVVHLNQA